MIRRSKSEEVTTEGLIDVHGACILDESGQTKMVVCW